VAAAEAVDDALRRGDLTLAAALFSPNLLSDVSAEVRAARLATAVAEVGGLAENPPAIEQRIGWAVAAAHVAWTLPGTAGDLELRMELTPTSPAMIQRLDVEVRKPVTALSPVTRRYRPTV
jgi:hypothetical protein